MHVQWLSRSCDMDGLLSMTLRTSLWLTIAVVFTIEAPSSLSARDRPKEIERVSFYAPKKGDSDDAADRVWLRIVEGRVYGVWSQRDPSRPKVTTPTYRAVDESPYWVTNQIVFHSRKNGPVQFLVADRAMSPPSLLLKKMQVDGFQWKADVLKSELRDRSTAKSESILMYIGVTNPAGNEYWLGFDDKPVYVKQNDMQVELRELILTPKREYRFQYTYRRYQDDGGK
jgi:hypothetical protein